MVEVEAADFELGSLSLGDARAVSGLFGVTSRAAVFALVEFAPLVTGDFFVGAVLPCDIRAR